MITYFIWNGSDEIIKLFNFLSLRWYGLLFALGFLVSQQILYYMYKKEGKPLADVDTLTVYMVIATIIGARLGHIIFYQPEIFWTDPWGVFLPFQFTPEFRYTGLMGLASHGAAFGILFALWLYSRYAIVTTKVKTETGWRTLKEDEKAPDGSKKGLFFIRRDKPGQSYIQVLDRIVILVMLAGAMIRLGNFFNSEIVGKPTDSSVGVVFAHEASSMFTADENGPVDHVTVKKNADVPNGPDGRKPINFYVFFKSGTTRAAADAYMMQNAKVYLTRSSEFIEEPWDTPLNYTMIEDTPGVFVARIHTLGIALHPAQLYESISCFLFFLFLLWLWSLRKADTRPGLIFGWFMVILWTLRFVYEFLKKNQVDFEDGMALNMGQILSIPLVIVGILVLVRAYRSPVPSKS